MYGGNKITPPHLVWWGAEGVASINQPERRKLVLG